MERLRLSRCDVGAEEKAAVMNVLERGYLGMGEDTRAFEVELESYLGGGRSVTSVATGCAALHLALQSCGLKPGDEVLVPSLTFIGCFQAIRAAGAVAVPCEVVPTTATIDMVDAARKITSRTRAIMPVHYAGFLPDSDRVYEVARLHGLRVVEDAAHAFGGLRNGVRIGSDGDIVCFSFDGIKNITCGEGGCVVTADDRVRQSVEDARLLGVVRDTAARYEGRRSWEFDVVSPGWRYHMNNIMAAIGRVQLTRLESEFIPARRRLARRYRAGLSAIGGVETLETDLESVVPHIQPIRVPNGKRDAVRRALHDDGIETGLHYRPNHLLTLFGAQRGLLPVTEWLYDELLTLPLHVGLSDSDVDRVLAVIDKAVELA